MILENAGAPEGARFSFKGGMSAQEIIETLKAGVTGLKAVWRA